MDGGSLLLVVGGDENVFDNREGAVQCSFEALICGTAVPSVCGCIVWTLGCIGETVARRN